MTSQEITPAARNACGGTADTTLVTQVRQSGELYLRGGGRPYNMLLLTDTFRLAYRALRCFHAAGAHVHVLGSKNSKGFAYSRLCSSFHYRYNDYRGDLSPLIDEINNLIVKLDIDMIACGDHYMVRPFIKMSSELNALCFPMPTIDQYELLNDKWRFTQLCNDLGVRCPRSRLFENETVLRAAIECGEVATPCMVKPVNFDGSRGVFAVRSRLELHKLESIEFSPILVQEFIAGHDICASVYCDKGEIRAFMAHRYARGTYSTFESSAIRADLEKILAATKTSGVLNFDMRLGLDGAVYWLECNPRFFMSIFNSYLAGVSFVEFGLPNWRISGSISPAAGTSVRFFKGVAAEILHPWRLTRRDLAYLGAVLADPLPWAREALGFESSGFLPPSVAAPSVTAGAPEPPA